MKQGTKQEIEVKLRVGDAAEMRRRLRRLGGRVVSSVHENNTLFDTPTGTLRKRGRLLRLREEKTLTGERQTRYVLTFKGPGQREEERTTSPPGRRRYKIARYKVRTEMEFIFGEPGAFLAMAAQEGLRPGYRYEKFRTKYRIPGTGTHVEFDATPAGLFLELEGPRRAIDRLARRLGYGPADYITRSYPALYVEACRRRGVPAGDMVFTSRKK